MGRVSEPGRCPCWAVSGEAAAAPGGVIRTDGSRGNWRRVLGPPAPCPHPQPVGGGRALGDSGRSLRSWVPTAEDGTRSPTPRAAQPGVAVQILEAVVRGRLSYTSGRLPGRVDAGRGPTQGHTPRLPSWATLGRSSGFSGPPGNPARGSAVGPTGREGSAVGQTQRQVPRRSSTNVLTALARGRETCVGTRVPRNEPHERRPAPKQHPDAWRETKAGWIPGSGAPGARLTARPRSCAGP